MMMQPAGHDSETEEEEVNTLNLNFLLMLLFMIFIVAGFRRSSQTIGRV